MKKYSSLIAISALTLLLAGLLSGCNILNNQSADESVGRVDETPATTAPEIPVATEPVATAPVPAPVMTDAELDQETKGLDASLDTVKTTGFEATNLTDKDLGL